MERSSAAPPVQLGVGSVVLYKPRRTEFFQAPYAGREATVAWCAASATGVYYYIEFPCGAILVASEGEIETSA